MSRTYQVNRGLNGGLSESTATIITTNFNGTNSMSNLDEEEEEESRKTKVARYIGVAFLFGLVLLSITFLIFSIFYDDIFNSNKETAEEFWDRIQKEIKLMQNKTNIELFVNKSDQKFISILTDNIKPKITSLKPSITFDNYISGDLLPTTVFGKWISNNEWIHYDKDNNLCITNVTDMTNHSILIPNNIIKEFNIFGFSLSPDRKFLLITLNQRSIYRYSSIARYQIFSIEKSILLPPLSSAEHPHDIDLFYAEWGTIGSQIIFVYRNDIYYKEDALSVPIRITKTGKEMLIYNGIPDWVYEEEIINGPKTFWVSPDGNDMVFASINDSLVDLMVWPIYGGAPTSERAFGQYTKMQSVRYPKPGRPNPTISLYYIQLSDLKGLNEAMPSIEQKIIPLEAPEEIRNFGEYLFTTFKWINTKFFAINWMNRAQNYSVMTFYTYQNNFQPIANFRLQSNNGWIELFTPPVIAGNGSFYLMKVPKISDNKKESFQHITKISVKSAESQFLTSGVFDVKEILGVNDQVQRIYFMAVFPDSPGAKHLLSVSLNQLEMKSEPICHTCLINTYSDNKDKPCLISDVTFSIGSEYYLLKCLGPNVPRNEIRKTVDHSLVTVLEDNQKLEHKLKDLALPKRIFKKVSVGDHEVDVLLIVPDNFNENSTTKYPILFNVYGGPGSDSGAISLKYFYSDFNAFMVSNRSIIYAYVDGRGNPNHGMKFMFEIYRRIGSVEIDDIVEVAKYFRDQPFIDNTSIGIWGWSYGGYAATMAMESDHNNSIFSCGVAVAPVSDWHYYDSVYTERYMGFPTQNDNLNNYMKASTLDKVQYLRGKHYLIMFGTADDNVHAMNSMMLLKALNEANIQYDTQIYPDLSHGLQNSLSHVYRRMIGFFDKCFDHK